MRSKADYLNTILIFFIVIFFTLTFFLNFSVKSEQQFSYLAQSFLQGKFYFLEKPGTWGDAAPFNDHYYWPLGPFPALLLMPFVYLFGLFNQFFYQGYWQFFIVLGTFYLIFKIAQKCGYSSHDSLFLSFAFTFASTFIHVAIWPWSWWFYQVIAVFLLFLSIFEYLGRKRYFVIGIFLGLSLATRISTSLATLFFILEIFFIKKVNFQKKLKNGVKLLIPIFFSIFLLAFYNYSRFGNFLQTGYSIHITLFESLAKARQYGLINLVHLPGNLYYFLLSTPLPVFKDNISHILRFPFIKANPWGMSIFVTSPYFIYLFFLNYKDRLSKILMITITLIALPIFLFFAIGFRQLGHKHSLDFLPFLFYLLIRNYKRQHRALSLGFKLLILISSLVNLYLFPTIFID